MFICTSNKTSVYTVLSCKTLSRGTFFSMTAGPDGFHMLCILLLLHCRSSIGLHGAGRRSQQWACPFRPTRVWPCLSTATPWCSPRPTRGLCRTRTKDTQTGSSTKTDSYGEIPEWQKASVVKGFFFVLFGIQSADWVLSLTDIIPCSMLLNQPMQTLVPTSSVTSQPSQCNMGISQTMWVRLKRATQSLFPLCYPVTEFLIVCFTQIHFGAADHQPAVLHATGQLQCRPRALPGLHVPDNDSAQHLHHKPVPVRLPHAASGFSALPAATAASAVLSGMRIQQPYLCGIDLSC